MDTVDRVDTDRVDTAGYGPVGGDPGQSEWIRWQQALQKRTEGYKLFNGADENIRGTMDATVDMHRTVDAAWVDATVDFQG